MALTVTRVRVKEKCSVFDTLFDSTIDSLIAEQVAAITPVILSTALADATIAPILNLGATEIVCGEFLAQRLREPGAGGAVTIGDVTAGPEASDGATLTSQGWARLSPFLADRVEIRSLGPKVEEEA